MEYLIDISSPAALDVRLSGRKAATLAQLRSKGYEVPHAVIVSTALLRDLFDGEGADILRSLPRTPDGHFSLDQTEIQQVSRVVRLPSAFLEELESYLRDQPEGKRFAVRSSSPLEDGTSASFAGQFDTFLNRTGFDSICEAVTLCLLSPLSSRVAAYLKFHAIAGELPMAVLIQEMVDADVAGVAFSINPLGPGLDQVVINARAGLGDAVVDGEEDVETFVLPKVDIKGTLPAEDTSAPAAVAVNALALTPDQQKAVGSLAVSLEVHFAFPQDIEWAIKDEKLYLLQARPVTVIPERWTRDDVVERFPNPITPLASDFLEEAFRKSVNITFSLMNFPAFRGVWVSNRDHFLYFNANAMEIYRNRLMASFRPLQQGMKGVRSCLTALKWVLQPIEYWQKNIDVYLTTHGELAQTPLANSNVQALWKHCVELGDLTHDYFAFNMAITMAHGALGGLLRAVLKILYGNEKGAVALADLTSGCKTKTAQFDRELHQLAALIQADGSPDLLTMKDAASFVTAISKKPALHREFEQFVKRHAHREIDNLMDMYYPTLGERPDVAVENLKLLMQEKIEVSSISQETIRYHAALSDVISVCPVEHRTELLELIELTRAYIELDDMEHYEMTRVQIPARRCLLALGENLVKNGILAEASDIFFGRSATIDNAVSSGNFTKLRAEVLQNQRSFKNAIGGSAELAPSVGLTAENSDLVLKGVPCSMGYVEGRACVVKSVDEFKKFEKGAILVARATPPPWSPLFYVATAIVTEAGGELSHGAVLARELRLPAIMGVKGLLREIRDGDRISVDGNTGRIARLV
jgi:rifampicin phosphotransferase